MAVFNQYPPQQQYDPNMPPAGHLSEPLQPAIPHEQLMGQQNGFPPQFPQQPGGFPSSFETPGAPPVFNPGGFPPADQQLPPQPNGFGNGPGFGSPAPQQGLYGQPPASAFDPGQFSAAPPVPNPQHPGMEQAPVPQATAQVPTAPTNVISNLLSGKAAEVTAAVESGQFDNVLDSLIAEEKSKSRPRATVINAIEARKVALYGGGQPQQQFQQAQPAPSVSSSVQQISSVEVLVPVPLHKLDAVLAVL